jgi:hypothetical protein
MTTPDIADLLNFGDPLGNLDDTDYYNIIDNGLGIDDEFNDNTLSQFLNGTNTVGSANDGSTTGGNVNPAGNFTTTPGVLGAVKDAIQNALGGGAAGTANAALIGKILAALLGKAQAENSNSIGSSVLSSIRANSQTAGATPTRTGTAFGIPKANIGQFTPTTNGVYNPTNVTLGMTR